jgi:hypothetical protein
MRQATIASPLVVVVAEAFAVVCASAQATDHAPQPQTWGQVASYCVTVRDTPPVTGPRRLALL